MVVPRLITEVISDKISNISSRDIYTRFRIIFLEDPINIPPPQFVALGLSTINKLDKSASFWTSVTRFGWTNNVAHRSTQGNIFETTAVIRDDVSAKSDYNYLKIEIWR